jgi:hypothetical protein
MAAERANRQSPRSGARICCSKVHMRRSSQRRRHGPRELRVGHGGRKSREEVESGSATAGQHRPVHWAPNPACPHPPRPPVTTVPPSSPLIWTVCSPRLRRSARMLALLPTHGRQNTCARATSSASKKRSSSVHATRRPPRSLSRSS